MRLEVYIDLAGRGGKAGTSDVKGDLFGHELPPNASYRMGNDGKGCSDTAIYGPACGVGCRYCAVRDHI